MIVWYEFVGLGYGLLLWVLTGLFCLGLNCGFYDRLLGLGVAVAVGVLV